MENKNFKINWAKYLSQKVRINYIFASEFLVNMVKSF